MMDARTRSGTSSDERFLALPRNELRTEALSRPLLKPRLSDAPPAPASSNATSVLRLTDAPPFDAAQRARLLDGFSYDAYLTRMAAALTTCG